MSFPIYDGPDEKCNTCGKSKARWIDEKWLHWSCPHCAVYEFLMTLAVIGYAYKLGYNWGLHDRIDHEMRKV